MVDEIRLLTKFSDMYYNQGINKQDIAKQLQISRPIVIRMLKSAQDLGIVDIHIRNLDLIHHWDLENELQKKFDLKEVIIVDQQPTSEALKQSLGKTACQYLHYNIKDQDTIGISMGSTLYYMIEAMQPIQKDVTIVPLIGGQGTVANNLHSNSLAHVMADRLSGQAISLLAPARVANRQLQQGLLKEESIASVLTYGNHLDIAIVGIGYPNEKESSIMATGNYKENEVEELLNNPHSGISCDKKTPNTLNMSSKDSVDAQNISVDLINDNPNHLRQYFKRKDNQMLLEDFSMPQHHPVLDMDISDKEFEVLTKAYEIQPENYEELILLQGIGPKKIRALALISDLVYGEPASWKDPVKYSFTHGGKDGFPYPVDQEVYDNSIKTIRDALDQARIKKDEKLKAIKRLDDFIS